MMKYHELVKHYVDDASYEDMVELAKETDDFVEEVRKDHPDMVEKFLIKLDLEINPKFGKETSKYATSKLKNKDGSVGEHWPFEVTSKALTAKGYEHDPYAWYYVLNLVYSMFYKPGRTDETYIEMANDIFVSDGGSCEIAKKLFKAINY